MALSTPPSGTPLGSATYPHRQYHGTLTDVRYAHSSGSDSNDGLTWGSAKLTILAAYDALPSTGGDIYIADNTNVGGEVDSQGIWIVGPGSGDYASPPTGWRQQKSGAVRFIGIPAGSIRKTTVANINGGSGTDRAKPTIWVQGNNKAINFEHLGIRYPAVGIRLGVNSAQTDRGISTAQIIFEGCSVQLNGVLGNGPGVDMGYCFWVYFINCHLSSTTAQATITACTTAANIATFTTSAAHNFVATDYVFVSDVTPSTYNGGWQVASAPTTTTFTVNLGSTPADGSAFGHVHPLRTDRASAILADGRGGGASPSFYCYNTTIDGSGIRYYEGSTTWGFILDETIAESDFVHPIGPVVEIMTGSATGNAIVSSISRADAGTAGGAEGASLQVAAGVKSNSVTAWNIDDVDGPMTFLGGISSPTTRIKPLSYSGTQGFEGGRIVGQHDAAKRMEGVRAVYRVNLADDDVANWSGLTGTATVTTGQLAPDGTTKAATLSSASGVDYRRVYSASVSMVAGDIFLIGTWVRRHSTSSDSTAPLRLGTSSGALQWDDIASNIADASYQRQGTHWQWVWRLAKCTTGSGGAATMAVDLRVTNGFNADFYMPTVLFWAAADGISEYDIRDYAMLFGPIPKTAAQGTMTTARGTKLIAWGGLGVGNDAAATGPVGNVVKKVEIFDETGASLGYLPVYDAIT